MASGSPWASPSTWTEGQPRPHEGSEPQLPGPARRSDRRGQERAGAAKGGVVYLLVRGITAPTGDAGSRGLFLRKVAEVDA